MTNPEISKIFSSKSGNLNENDEAILLEMANVEERKKTTKQPAEQKEQRSQKPS